MEGLKQGGKGGGEGIGGASGTMGREKEGNSADGDKSQRNSPSEIFAFRVYGIAKCMAPMIGGEMWLRKTFEFYK